MAKGRGFKSAPMCPPGVLCFSNGIMLVILVILLAVGVILWHIHTTNKSTLIMPTHIINKDSDHDQYRRSPEPNRLWNTVPDLRGAIIPPGSVPINMPTRYYPEQYQQMGLLKTADQQILPLYGRRTGTSTDRYNYYTRTDTFNPIQIPVSYQKRNCMDDIGCNELMGGEDINIHGLDKSGHVEIYKYDAPKYIPSLL